MDKNMLTTLYNSIVRPHLEYGSNIYGQLCITRGSREPVIAHLDQICFQ
jgi:hypothetical protein